MNKEFIPMVKAAYEGLEDKFAKDIVVLDISNVSVMADFFIIATAGNANQMKAMADEVGERLLKQNVKLRHSEGYGRSSWVLLDFGVIIVHLFTKEERAFYNLERVWGDAPMVSAEQLNESTPPA